MSAYNNRFGATYRHTMGVCPQRYRVFKSVPPSLMKTGNRSTAHSVHFMNGDCAMCANRIYACRVPRVCCILLCSLPTMASVLYIINGKRCTMTHYGRKRKNVREDFGSTTANRRDRKKRKKKHRSPPSR